MFSLFRKKKKENQLFDYTFIWYKKMEVKNKTIYTQPFRTTVKAKNEQEAKEKLTKLALNKMKLVIAREDVFNKTDLSRFQQRFDEMNQRMEELFNKYKKG